MNYEFIFIFVISNGTHLIIPFIVVVVLYCALNYLTFQFSTFRPQTMLQLVIISKPIVILVIIVIGAVVLNLATNKMRLIHQNMPIYLVHRSSKSKAQLSTDISACMTLCCQHGVVYSSSKIITTRTCYTRYSISSEKRCKFSINIALSKLTNRWFYVNSKYDLSKNQHSAVVYSTSTCACILFNQYVIRRRTSINIRMYSGFYELHQNSKIGYSQ